MASREQVVIEARTWIGTPWHHQATVKQVGVDCIGLLRGTLINVGVLAPMKNWVTLGVPEKYRVYDRAADGVTMLEAFDRYWTRIPVSDIQPGDVLVLNLGGRPQHVGIVAEYRAGGLSLIHAPNDRGRGTGVVVEHRMIPQLLSKAVAAYSIPGVA